MQRLEVSGTVRHIYGSLGVKRVITCETRRFYKLVTIIAVMECTSFRSKGPHTRTVLPPVLTAQLITAQLNRECVGKFRTFVQLKFSERQKI